ncbi:MAG: signal recognition particle protein, partial [Rhodothermales bacterium]
SFVEKAQEQFDDRQAEQLRKKIRSQDFDLADFYEQLQKIKNMGSLRELIGMIPGVGRQIRDLDVDDDAFKGIEAIILSMTPEERRNPSILNGSRRRRIARGSGSEVRDVNQLLKQFKEMKKMMKTMSRMMGKGRSVDLEQMMGRLQ